MQNVSGAEALTEWEEMYGLKETGRMEIARLQWQSYVPHVQWSKDVKHVILDCSKILAWEDELKM